MLEVLQWSEPILVTLAIIIIMMPHLARFLITKVLSSRRNTDKKALQTQITEYRKELAKISQVDEFAKYSKVQRKLRASTDQLSSITRQDLELHLKYVVIVQALAWLIAVVFGFRLLYQLFSILLTYAGFA